MGGEERLYFLRCEPVGQLPTAGTLGQPQQKPVDPGQGNSQPLGIDVPQVLNEGRILGEPMPHQLHPQMIAGHPVVKGVARPGRLLSLQPGVADYHSIRWGEVHRLLQAEGKEADMDDRPLLGELHGRMVGASTPRAHEPLPLPAQIHELSGLHLQPIDGHRGLCRGHHQCRGGAESGAYGDVAADHHIQTLELSLGELLL